jgi:hypothetical protein
VRELDDERSILDRGVSGLKNVAGAGLLEQERDLCGKGGWIDGHGRREIGPVFDLRDLADLMTTLRGLGLAIHRLGDQRGA